MRRQRVCQVYPSYFRKLVAGKPIKKRRGTGSLYDMFGEGCRIDQTNAFTDGLCFFHSILPPPATTKTPRLMIKIIFGIQRPKIIRPFKSVHTTKLCAQRFLSVIGWCRTQGTAGFAFLVRMVKNIDMFITLFVFTCGIFSGHPVAVAFRVKARHINFSFAFDHHLGKVISRATRRCDAKRKPFGNPHVTQSGGRPN